MSRGSTAVYVSLTFSLCCRQKKEGTRARSGSGVRLSQPLGCICRYGPLTAPGGRPLHQRQLEPRQHPRPLILKGSRRVSRYGAKANRLCIMLWHLHPAVAGLLLFSRILLVGGSIAHVVPLVLEINQEKELLMHATLWMHHSQRPAAALQH